MPSIVEPVPPGQDETGIVKLNPARAQFQNLEGPGARYESSKECIGHWTSDKAQVYWSFTIENPGVFSVIAEVAGLADSEFVASLSGQSENVKIPASGDYNEFSPLTIGSFSLEEEGEYTILLSPVTGAWNPVNLRSVQLIPIQK